MVCLLVVARKFSWRSALNGITVLSIPFNITLKLLEIIKKYQKKKRTESLLISAFEREIGTYIDIYEKVIAVSEEKIMPILDSIGDELSPHDMNRLLDVMSSVPLLHAEWIEAFIDFARACSEVSALEGLMEYLKEADIVFYDFVNTMKNTYVREKNKVVIDGRYYRFFKTYENDIFGKFESDRVIKELKPYVGKLRRFVKKIRHYANKTALIDKKILKKYRKNYRVFLKASEAMTIEETAANELIAYVPEKLLPIAVSFEELLL